MPASIGINLRVTGHSRQGGRKYMEDCFSVAYQQTDDERDLEYAFFGIYDGHGGAEAAAFAKEHLMDIIVRHKSFWSDNDDEVLKAIKDGYIATHYAMWKEQEKWPKTASGLPSTAGTTASVAFVRKGKIYIGHVGDSGIILGYQDPNSSEWKAKPLTRDHKPESVIEMARIEQCGGKVVAKSGVPRVVWNRPRIGHKGPVRRSTPIVEIPFLAVARSLGDLWSYNSQLDEFVVSPEPDCSVIPIDTNSFRCLIFGTDGLYNMLSPQLAVHIVQQAERHNENAALSDAPHKIWLNPSKCLVEEALERWSNTKMRADNTTVITIMLDPPGPPRAEVLKNKKKNYSDSGMQIVTRYENQVPEETNTMHEEESTVESQSLDPLPSCSDTTYLDFSKNSSHDDKSEISCSSQITTNNVPKFETFDKNFLPKTRESLSFDPCSAVESSDCINNTVLPETTVKLENNEENIQINEISSSSNDIDITKDDKPMRLTKRRNIGKTKRILNPAEHFRHLKQLSQNVIGSSVESAKNDVVTTNSKILQDSNASLSVSSNNNAEVSKKPSLTDQLKCLKISSIVTRSKTKNDETTKENDSPKKELNKAKIVSLEEESRLTRKRILEALDKAHTKRSKLVTTKTVVLRKDTRQSFIDVEQQSPNITTEKNNNKQSKKSHKEMKPQKRTLRTSTKLSSLLSRRTETKRIKLPKKSKTKKQENKKSLKQKRKSLISEDTNKINIRSNHQRRSRK